ncbi:MAG: ATP-binding protein [Deltaproteobacteria bacterium]|nr:ATP-binding protein [Deltaproteobacteria bacterium]
MLSIQLKNDMKELKRLQKSVEDLGDTLRLSGKVLFHINLALEEIFTNIVSHGYTDEGEHLIKITMSRENDFLCFRIEDDGIPFNPLKARPPELKGPLEERPIGGLGCYLMRCCMDDVKYERRGNKNILTMKRCINTERPRPVNNC